MGAQNTARRKRRPTAFRQRGFSLLEILVVVVIIGILVSIVTINIDLRDTRSEKHAQRLSALIELAADEAMIHGQETGLRFYRQQYEFSVFNPDTGIWELIDDDEMFRPRTIEEDLRLDIRIEDREIVLTNPPDKPSNKKPAKKKTKANTAGKKTDNSDNEYEPQIFILSSGEITPFSVRFYPEFKDDGYELTVAVDGKATVTADADADANDY